jgi:hypothetical protein
MGSLGKVPRLAVRAKALSPGNNGFVIHHAAGIYIGQGFARKPLLLFGTPAFRHSHSLI